MTRLAVLVIEDMMVTKNGSKHWRPNSTNEGKKKHLAVHWLEAKHGVEFDGLVAAWCQSMRGSTAGSLSTRVFNYRLDR